MTCQVSVLAPRPERTAVLIADDGPLPTVALANDEPLLPDRDATVVLRHVQGRGRTVTCSSRVQASA